MSWWGWVVVGAVLLGAELTLVNVELYFVFIGGAAVITGLVAALVPAFTAWMQWALFACLAIVSMTACRRRIHGLVKGNPPAVDSSATGATLVVPMGLAPGQSCQIEHAGSFWTIRNDGPAALQAGTKARVEAVEGLTLVLRPAA